MSNTATEFPVAVAQSESGDYVARLVDLPEGPEGHGVDPYAALDDLTDRANPVLSELHKDGILPAPSPIDDRPVVRFEQAAKRPRPLATGKGDQSQMIGYSWTNDLVFPDS